MIVYQAKLRRGKTGSTLAFFYCDSEYPETLSPLTILGSFVKQIASHFEKLSKPAPDSLAEKIEQVEGRRLFDVDDLVEILLDFSAKSLETFFILDGLDECRPEDREEILSFFKQLLNLEINRSSCKVLVSSREDVDVSRTIPSCLHLSICATHTSSDIRQYVDNIVNERIRAKKIFVGEGSLVAEIKERLTNGAQGM